MTRIKVVAGACGFTSVIKITKTDKIHVAVKIFSACKIIRGMVEDLQEIDWLKGLFVKKMSDSIIYQSASKRLVHTDCPVPSAILKGILVEVGAVLPKDVSIHFEKSGEEK